MYPGLPMQPAAAGVRELMHRELSHSRELMHIGEMYHQCLLYAPLPTKAITNAGVYGTADLLQQVRGGKPIDKRRIWSFFVTGLGSGVLWACYYDVADYVVNAKPVTDVVGVGAVQRTIMSLAIQQFVWCPIMFSTYQIPAAVLQNGGKFSEIPGAVRERLLELLIKSAKIFTVADIVIYNIPLEWRVLAGNAIDIVWASACSNFAASCDENVQESYKDREAKQIEDSSDGDGEKRRRRLLGDTCKPQTQEQMDCKMGGLMLGTDRAGLAAHRKQLLPNGAHEGRAECKPEPDEGHGRRLSPEDWHDAWQNRFECWWGGLPLPTQTQLSTCAGALALHLGSRLNAVWGASTQGAAPVGAGDDCQWVEQRVQQLQLPAFPDLPEGGFPIELMPLAPLPALLPGWLQLQWMQSSAQVWQPIGPPTLEHADETPQNGKYFSAMAAGYGVGIGAGAVMCWLGVRGMDHIRRRGRGQMTPSLRSMQQQG